MPELDALDGGSQQKQGNQQKASSVKNSLSGGSMSNTVNPFIIGGLVSGPGAVVVGITAVIMMGWWVFYGPGSKDANPNPNTRVPYEYRQFGNYNTTRANPNDSTTINRTQNRYARSNVTRTLRTRARGNNPSPGTSPPREYQELKRKDYRYAYNYYYRKSQRIYKSYY